MWRLSGPKIRFLRQGAALAYTLRTEAIVNPGDTGPPWLQVTATLDRPTVCPQAPKVSLRLRIHVQAPGPEVPGPGATDACCVLNATSDGGATLAPALQALPEILRKLPPRSCFSLVVVQRGGRCIFRHVDIDEHALTKVTRKLSRLAAKGQGEPLKVVASTPPLFEESSERARLLLLFGVQPNDPTDWARWLDFGATVVAFGTETEGPSGASDAPAVLPGTDASEMVSGFESFFDGWAGQGATASCLSLKLGSGVDLGLGYRTTPEKSMLGTLKTDAQDRLAIELGPLAPGEQRGLLFLLKVPADRVGEQNVASVSVAYDAPAWGHRARVVRVEVPFFVGEPEVAPSVSVDLTAQRARLALLAERIIEAHRHDTPHHIVALVKEAAGVSESLGDVAMGSQFETMLNHLETKRKLTRAMLDRCAGVRASLNGSPRTFYEVVMLSPGDEPLRVARELRDVTGLPLREVQEMLEGPSKIGHGLGFAQANALRRRMQKAGASIEVRRFSQGPDAPSDTP